MLVFRNKTQLLATAQVDGTRLGTNYKCVQFYKKNELPWWSVHFFKSWNGMTGQGWEGLTRSVSTHVALAGCVGPVAKVTTSGAPCEAIRLGWSAKHHTIPPVSRSSLRCNSKLPGINYINFQGVELKCSNLSSMAWDPIYPPENQHK